MASDDRHAVAYILFASWISVMCVVVAQVTSNIVCLFVIDIVGRLQCTCCIHLLQTLSNWVFFGFVLVQICYLVITHFGCMKKHAESKWSPNVPIVVAHDSMT